MADWQPISTAPKDGTEILVGIYAHDGEEFIWCQWTAEYNIISSWPWGTEGINGEEPTHWHPLPLPPEQE